MSRRKSLKQFHNVKHDYKRVAAANGALLQKLQITLHLPCQTSRGSLFQWVL